VGKGTVDMLFGHPQCKAQNLYTVVSPQTEHPNSEQILKVTGFRGDGRPVIQNVTLKANIVGPQSDGFGFWPWVKFHGYYAGFEAFSSFLSALCDRTRHQDSFSWRKWADSLESLAKKSLMSQPQGQIWRSREYLQWQYYIVYRNKADGIQLCEFYSISNPGILRENIMFGIWVFESSKRTIVRFKNHRPTTDRCQYTEQIHKVTGLLGDGGCSLRGLTTVARFIHTAYTLCKSWGPNGNTWIGESQSQKQGDE